MQLIDGKIIVERMYRDLESRIVMLKKKGVLPGLGIVMAGNDPASEVYVSKKELAATGLGIACSKVVLPENVSCDEVIAVLEVMNNDSSMHGIIVQLPLPSHLDTQEILTHIAKKKDIDALRSDTEYDSPTVEAVIKCIELTGLTLENSSAVVVGKGFFGTKIADRLKREGALVAAIDRDDSLFDELRDADLIVSAAGVPGLIVGSMVKDDVVIVDVGITRVGDKVVGDVDMASVAGRAAWITPVPGGVGPVTVACLMEAVVRAAEGS